MNTPSSSFDDGPSRDSSRFFSTVGFHGDIKSKLTSKKLTDDDDFSLASIEHNPYSMTEDVLRERAKKKHHGNVMAQLSACLTLTLGSISNGFTIGSTSPKIRTMYNTHPEWYEQENAHFASIVALGLALGNFVLTILCITKGPRKIIIFTVPAHFLACLIMPVMHTASFQTAMMFFCAFFSIGYINCGVILLNDIVHEAFYYAFFLIFKSGHGFGIMLAYIFGLSPDLEYYADGLGALILSVFFILLFYLPESPVFLYAKNPMQAEKALIYFRGTNDIQIIMRHIAKDQQCRIVSIATKYMMLSRAVYKAIIIISIVAVLQVFYGYHLFLMYSVSMWSTNHNQDVVGQFEDGVILGVSYYVIPFCTQAMNLRSTFGVRKPMLISAIAVPITLILYVTYFYMLDNRYAFVLRNQWISFVIRGCHTLAYNLGHSFCIQALIADYLPEQVQVWASAIILTLRYLIMSILLGLTSKLEAAFHTYTITLFFATVAWAGIPFCYYFIVESKGKTLQQIQLEIGGNPIGTRSSFRSRYRRYLESNA